jgi:histidyl-tRNA synthetase
MTQAGRSGAAYALIIGENEIAADTLTVRDLKEGTETALPSAQALALMEEAATKAKKADN